MIEIIRGNYKKENGDGNRKLYNENIRLCGEFQ